MTVRPETPADFPAVFRVQQSAFGQDDEARLVDRLRACGHARVSLVAERDGEVVGHILFSELKIIGTGRTCAGLALAPLAVLPELQSQGIGSTLVRRGLEACRQAGHAIVIVLGHPAYYPRFGFSPQAALPLESPYAGPSFMALELVAGALAGVAGRVEYPPPFSAI